MQSQNDTLYDSMVPSSVKRGLLAQTDLPFPNF